MNPQDKRAAIAIRLIAIVELILVTRLWVVGLLRDRILAQLRSGRADYHALFERLDAYGKVSFYAHLVLVVALFAGSLMLILALRRGRGIASGGLVALIAHLGLMIANRVIKVPDPIPFSIKLMWWADGTCLTIACLLPLVAFARAVESKLSRYAAIGALAIIAIDAAFSAYTSTLKDYTQTHVWLERSLSLTSAVFFASFAFPLAKHWLKGGAVDQAPAPAGALDGTPLRALAWALLARIGLGLTLQGLLMASLVQGEYENAGVLTSFGTAINVILGLIVIGALIAYMRFPATHRGESLIAAIGFLAVGIVLDVSATNAATELFELAGQAKRATSFWGGPSLARVEELQTTMTWLSRIALVLGVIAGFAIVSSLLRTATAIADSVLAGKARRVMKLLVVTGVAGGAISFLASSPSQYTVVLLLIVAFVLLGVALFLLVDWMSLLFGLAKAVERPPDAPKSAPA